MSASGLGAKELFNSLVSSHVDILDLGTTSVTTARDVLGLVVEDRENNNESVRTRYIRLL